jgi:hypothetical protein
MEFRRNAWTHRKDAVVSVSETSGLLLSDTHSSLLRVLNRRPQTDPAILFAHWILARSEDEAEAKQIASAAAQHSGAQLDFHTVSALGFARESGLVGPEISATLKQGLERLAGRQPFVDGNPMPFCSDAVGILGVAFGTRALGDTAVTTRIAAWLSSYLVTIYGLDGTEDWQRHLFRAADSVITAGISLPAVSNSRAAEVLVALAAKGLPHAGLQLHREEGHALKTILSEAGVEIPYERAAIRLTALGHLVRSAPVAVPGRISPQDLVRLLERIPAGLRKWTWETKPRTAGGLPQQWHIDNEYHVQNLLWVMLAPIFPDLDDEQYLTKIGQKSPRADLYIASMKIIIEAKFLRAGETMQKVIDQISSDTGLYSVMGNDCAGIVPVIWDDSARSHEHDYLRHGLKKLPNIIDAIVFSRPGWIGENAESSKKTKGKKPSKA